MLKAEANYDVVINDVVDDDATAQTLAGLGERGAHPVFVKGNIGDLDGMPALVDRAFEAFGGLECLVNNAGISVSKRGDILEVTHESYDKVMNVNLRGPFFLMQEVARRMIVISAGAYPRSIINLSSVNATVVSPDRAEYCLSKAAFR
jgi:3-oxoacyl-[acyl-carrier protein] reductase